MHPVATGQPFDAEVHSFLIHAVASNDGYTLAEHEKVGMPDIRETNVLRGERPSYLTSVSPVPQVQGR